MFDDNFNEDLYKFVKAHNYTTEDIANYFNDALNYLEQKEAEEFNAKEKKERLDEINNLYVNWLADYYPSIFPKDKKEKLSQNLNDTIIATMDEIQSICDKFEKNKNYNILEDNNSLNKLFNLLNNEM